MVIDNMHKKNGEDRTRVSEDMIADRQTHTHRETDRHAHHNTPLPHRGRSNYTGETLTRSRRRFMASVR